MAQVSWQMRAIRSLIPATDIEADDKLIEKVLKDLIANNTVYSYIVDYFKAELKLEEIATKHNIDANKFVIIVRNTLNKLKQNGFLKYITANGDNMEDLVNQISYNTTRYHISYLPIPLDLISILDRRYQFTMISDLIDLYYGDEIPSRYIHVASDALSKFHLIDEINKYDKDEYPVNIFRRLYFTDKNESITELPKNFEENIEYILRNIGIHGDEFDIIIMKYKEHKTYRDISIEMKCDEKDIQYAIDNIFRILREPGIAKALALGIRPTIKRKKVDSNISDTSPITESSSIDRLSGTLRAVLITRLKENGINTISDLKSLSRMSLLSMNSIGDVSADEIIRVAKIYGIEIPRYRKDSPLFKNVKTPGSRTIDKTRRMKKNAEGGCLYHTLEELRNKELETEVDIWPINFVSKLDPNISQNDINIDGVNFILDQLTTKYGKTVILAIYKEHKRLNEVSRMIPGYNPSGVFRSVVHEIASNPVLKRLLTVSIDEAKENVKVNPNHYLPENILMWGIRLYTMNKYINPHQIYSLRELLDIVGWTIHDLDFLTYDRIKKANRILIKNYCMFINFTNPRKYYKIPDDASICEKILYGLGLYHLPGSDGEYLDILYMRIRTHDKGKKFIKFIDKIEGGLSIDHILERDLYMKKILIQLFEMYNEFFIYGLKDFNDRYYKSLSCIGFTEDEEKLLAKLLHNKFNIVGDVYVYMQYLEDIFSVDEIDALNKVFKRIGLVIPD